MRFVAPINVINSKASNCGWLDSIQSIIPIPLTNNFHPLFP